MTDKKKIISFSLWGNEPKYTVGALANAMYAEEVYPDWVCRFYISSEVDVEVIQRLEEMDRVEVIVLGKSQKGDHKNSLLRFLPAEEDDIEVVIFRDCDSRLNYREQAAVNEWLQSDKKFHIMYDHPNYSSFFLAGCWGVKYPGLAGVSALIRYYLMDVVNRPWEKIATLNDESQLCYRKGVDQNFLENVVYPIAQLSCMRHDDFSQNVLGYKIGRPFPTHKSIVQGYVGESLNVDESPAEPEWRILAFEKPAVEVLMERKEFIKEIQEEIVKDFS